ncbi:MAG: hypothetical protein WC451_04540 [Patescibacteria group bacterium]|jgi:hypothetical protein
MSELIPRQDGVGNKILDQIHIKTEPTFIHVEDNGVPAVVTDEIITDFELPEKLRETTTFCLESYFSDQLSSGKSEDEIIADFLANFYPILAAKLADMRKQFSKKEPVDKKIPNSAKSEVLSKMSNLGLPQSMIDEISEISVNITNNFGSSHAGYTSVAISRAQIFRKAVDLAALYPEHDADGIEQALMSSVIKHELGHKIDDISQHVSSKIQSTWEFGENRGERFAEFWGRINPSGSEEQIRQLYWQTEIANLSLFWRTLQEANLLREDKINVFRMIKKIIDQIDNQDVISFIHARTDIWRMAPPENYASPYAEDQIREAYKEAS